jgi:hypothetical protein
VVDVGRGLEQEVHSVSRDARSGPTLGPTKALAVRLLVERVAVGLKPLGQVLQRDGHRVRVGGDRAPWDLGESGDR